MPSKREQILQAFGTILAATPGIGGRVYRSQADGLTRDLTPCITYEWSSEDAMSEGTVLAERMLPVSVSVIVRGDTPDALADPIITAAHALLMADPSLGGLALDVTLSAASFEFEGADKTAGRLTHEYAVMFRHSHSDLTI